MKTNLNVISSEHRNRISAQYLSVVFLFVLLRIVFRLERVIIIIIIAIIIIFVSKNKSRKICVVRIVYWYSRIKLCIDILFMRISYDLAV